MNANSVLKTSHFQTCSASKVLLDRSFFEISYLLTSVLRHLICNFRPKEDEIRSIILFAFLSYTLHEQTNLNSVNYFEAYYPHVQLIAHNYTPKLHTHNYTPTTTHPQLHNYKYTPTTTHLQLHTYNYTPTTTHLQLHTYNYTPTTTHPQLHTTTHNYTPSSTHPLTPTYTDTPIHTHTHTHSSSLLFSFL
jgi:hypothetical protein